VEKSLRAKAWYLHGRLDNFAPIDRTPYLFQAILEELEDMSEEELEAKLNSWWGDKWKK
jgi:hypothetical protein